MALSAAQTTDYCYAGAPGPGRIGCREYDRAQQRPALLESGSGPLCPDCLRCAERDVRQLPYDYRDLEQLVPPSIGQWSDGQPAQRARGEHPLPVREHVLVLQRHIWWVLTAWEPVVREAADLSDEIRVGVREGWAIQRAVQVVAPRLTLLARVGATDMPDYPDVDAELPRERYELPEHLGRPTTHHNVKPTGADGVLHLMRLHNRARAMTGLTKMTRKLPGNCHECLREETLRQHEPRQHKDDPPVWCCECGAWRPYDEYERLMRLIVWQDA